MRLLLVFASILTLSLALGSTLMTIITIGGATGLVEQSISGTMSEGMGSVQGYVTIDIEARDLPRPLDDEVAAVKGLPS